MVDLMVDGWSREGIPRGSFGPVREVGFLDLPQEVFYCLVTHMTDDGADMTLYRRKDDSDANGRTLMGSTQEG